MNIFIRLVLLASVRLIDFFLFLFNFGQGPIREYFLCRSAPGFQTTITFYSLVQIQRNQRPRLRYDPLYPLIQLKRVFESFKI